MSVAVAGELAALEMSNHARRRTLWWTLPSALALAAVATNSVGHALWPVAAAAWVTVAAWPRLRILHHYGRAHMLLAANDVPAGRLHVLCLALVSSRPGHFSFTDFARVLTQGPDELSCTALGSHIDRFCPHRRDLPNLSGPATT